VDLGSVYTTMQTFMGGYLVNYFNRFGRQWQWCDSGPIDDRPNLLRNTEAATTRPETWATRT
jgi:hypothetical protein